MSRRRASRFPDPHADRPPLLVAVLLGLQLGLQPGQSREPQIGHVMMMVRVLVEVDAALRAQSPAVLAAQGLQWQRLHQRVTQQRLQVGERPVSAQRIHVLGLVLPRDDLHVLVLGLAVRAGGAPGGDDALAMSICKLTKWNIQWAYLASDLVVLALSATYIPLSRLGYSLLTVLLSGQLIGLVQNVGKKRTIQKDG